MHRLLLPMIATTVLGFHGAAYAQQRATAAPESSTHDPATLEAPALDPRRTALIFIEFQQEWIGEDATLTDALVKDKAGIGKAVEAAKHVLTEARAQGWHVVHAGLDLSRDPNYLVFGQGREKLGLRRAIPQLKTWQQHGAAFVPPFVPEADEYVVSGRTGASVLTNSTLDAYLRNNGIDTIVLLGFATHVCVESTLRQGHDMGYNVFVVNDAVAPFEPEQQRYFEEHVLHHFGAGISATALASAIKGAKHSVAQLL